MSDETLIDNRALIAWLKEKLAEEWALVGQYQQRLAETQRSLAESREMIAHYEKWLGEELAAATNQPVLTVMGKWRGTHLVWRFEQAGKVHFCHDVKLRRWIFRNLGLCCGEVIRRKETEAYWKARQGK